jgi:hypothetical protein
VADPQRIKHVTRVIADGTGLSDAELKFYAFSTVVTGIVLGAATAYVGIVRFRDYLRDG